MRNRITYALLALALISGAVALRALDPAPIVRLRLLVFDTYQWLAPRIYDPDLPVRIVDIDDESISKVGQWPWPRSVLARMTERLTELGASSIAFDIVLAEADRSAPAELLKRLPADLQQDPALQAIKARLGGMAGPDAELARAIAAGPVVLGFIGSNDGGPVKINRRAGFATAGDDPKQFIAKFRSAVASLEILQANGKGAGSLNWVPEHDQIIRRLPLLVSVGNELYPSLSAEALRVGQGAGSYVVKASGASGEEAFGRKTGLVSVRIGQIAVPTDAEGHVWLRFTKRDPRRFISAARLLDGKVERAEIEARVVLVGTSAPGLFDLRTTPLDGAVAGVEVHAQAVEQMLLDTHLRRPDFATGAEIVLLAVSGLAMAALVYLTGAVASAVLGGLTVATALAGSWYAFKAHGWLLDPVYPVVALILTYLFTTAYLYRRTEVERNRVRDAFKHYLAPSLVEELAKHPDKLKLGGELRPVTLLFCDVRGFTSISERLSAEQLTQFLNRLLTPLTNTILANRGTVDKYIGDAIMAFWNAPLDDEEHERNAAKAALGMLQELEVLNQRWAAEAASRGEKHVPVRIGIGLNTAECCVGNLGSELRFDYSVIGDGVNVASRLEGQCKHYGLAVMMGESTAEKAADLALLEVDLVSVVGRQAATRIYTMLGDGAAKASPGFAAVKQLHDAMLAAYRARRFDDAGRLIDQASALPEAGPLAGLYARYRQRIAVFKRAPPPPDWNGVAIAEEK
jgi:adenylate cyclase